MAIFISGRVMEEIQPERNNMLDGFWSVHKVMVVFYKRATQHNLHPFTVQAVAQKYIVATSSPE